ncbi:LCP family protein [Parafrigoribacterium soli]|uniref:LCP family protein n=1 Tax=Parafrigoribacterium soli TaxID=3144663 RepID=UPI0032F080D3
MAAGTRGKRSASPAPVRHGQQKVRGPVGTLARILAVVVAVAVVSTASIAGFAVWNLASSVKPGIHLSHLAGKPKVDVTNIGAIEGGVNMLLTGTDTRSGQGGSFATKDELRGSSGVGNNDVTMLIHIAADHKSVTVISFPRDLLVPVPSCPRAGGGSYPSESRAMLNSTLPRGDLPCVVLTIEKLLGIDIPFAAKITLDGVIAMSDAVGGVSVCIASPINDRMVIPPVHLPAGEATLVGADALSFLRTRHGLVGGSDLARISNQQLFMSALARKVTSAGVLSNPLELYSLANAAVHNVTMSDTLTNPTTLVEIALALKNVGLDHMVFLQFPSVADPSNPNRVVPQISAATALKAALAADQPVALSGTTGGGTVLVPTTPTTPPTASGSATAAPTTAPTQDAVVLPPSVTGQTAADQTCAKGQGR